MATLFPQDLDQIISNIFTRLKKLEIRGNNTVIKTGLAADRPTTPVVSIGTTTQYYAYDTKVLSIWNIDTDSWNTVAFT